MNFFDMITGSISIIGVVIICLIICQYITYKRTKKCLELHQKVVMWCNTIYENQETLLKDLIKLKRDIISNKNRKL